MGSKRKSVKSELSEYLSQNATARVTEAEWAAILRRFSPASASYLRRLLRQTGLPLDPMVEGVRQDSYEHLERTLLALEEVYSTSRGDAGRQARCRALVIEAKDHARWAARRTKDNAKRAEKHEMVRWMLVWLDNLSAFSPWVRLRKRKLAVNHDLMGPKHERSKLS